ncbi:MAG: hypothetical protein ACYDHH_28570 [Solirubrobacteraceae bacterium]
MDASGGMGTLNPPSDGDNFAEVTPLRRREPQLVAVPTVRDPLPAENSVWDTDDHGAPSLRRSRTREILGALAVVWGFLRSPLTIRPRAMAGAGAGLACIAVVTAIALGAVSGPAERPHRTLASSSTPLLHRASTIKVFAPAVQPAHRLTRHRARQPARHTNRPRRTHASARRAVVTRRHTTTPAASAPSRTATQTPPAPASTSSAAASSTVAPTAGTSQATRPAGPSGSGAAFGPGY